MHMPGPLFRMVDALVTAMAVVAAGLGVLIAWMLGLLPELSLAMLLVGVVAPHLHALAQPDRPPRRPPGQG